MRLRKIHWMGMIFAVIAITCAIIFLSSEKIFYFILGISMIIGALPFIVSLIIENEKEKELDEMFLEFSRNLVESVKSGTPISKSIINLRNKNYGRLSSYIKKLANQISIGIPVKQALETFAYDTKSKVILRAIMLIKEAEHAGGNIESILESTAQSISEIENLKKERRAAISSLVVQGYIIFLIFIIIMLVMEFQIVPMTSGIADVSTSTDSSLGTVGGFGTFQFTSLTAEELSRPFLFLLITQGLFTGLVIGKLSDGNLKSGVKHSFFLIILAILISTGARFFLG